MIELDLWDPTQFEILAVFESEWGWSVVEGRGGSWHQIGQVRTMKDRQSSPPLPQGKGQGVTKENPKATERVEVCGS